MSRADEAADLARRKAQDLLDRNKVKNDERLTEVLKQRRHEATKTARLRELRLAKEAVELEEKKAAKAQVASLRNRPVPRSG